MSRRGVGVATAVAGALAVVIGAHAAIAKPLPPPGPPPDPSRGETYDGRKRPREKAGRELALLLPRAVLAFPRMALEVVRMPLIYVLEYTETKDEHGRNRAAPRKMRGWGPVLTFLGGEMPAVGFEVWARDVFGPGVMYTAATAYTTGTNHVQGRIVAEPNPMLPFGMGVRLKGVHRTDEPFFGMPGDVPYDADGDDIIRRVQVSAFDASIFGAIRPGGGAGEWRFTVLGGVGLRRFAPGDRGETVDPMLTPGYDDGAQFVRGGLTIKRISPFDASRDMWGVDVTLGSSYTHGLGADESRYVTSELEIVAGFPLNQGRALVATVLVGDQHSWGDDPVSFYDRFHLGGSRTHRGFHSRRFRGGSAVLGQLDYRFPLLMQVDGLLFVENGGAFEEHFDGFDPAGLRTSVGVGMRVAWGTTVLRGTVGWGFGDGLHFGLNLDTGN